MSTAQKASHDGPAWPIVMRREIVAKLTDKTFLIGTLVTIALIVVVLGVQAFLGDRAKTYDLAVSPSARAMAEAIVTDAPGLDDKVKITLRQVADDSAGRAAVQDNQVDAWLHRDGDAWALTGRTDIPTELKQAAATVVQREVVSANASAAGTTPEAIQAGSVLRTDQLVGDPARTALGQGLSFAMAMLFYIASLMFGITLANSVVEEKQSRIVEIIAAAIPVRQLLAGKILGNCALAFGQMLIYAAIGLVGLRFTSYGSYLPAVSGPLLWFVVFFVIGFLAIAALYAVAGALASRTEDVQSTSTPLTVLVLAVFFGSAFASGNLETVLSFIPPFSTVIMPARMLAGAVPWWQVAAALVGLLAFAALALAVGSRLYRRALLQTQGKLSVRAAWGADV